MRERSLHAENPLLPNFMLSSGQLSIYRNDELENQKKISIKQSVDELLEVAGEENWDNEDAMALVPRTVEVAKELVDSFPPFLPLPDISATPHGEIDFDWDISKGIVLGITVCPSDEIVFAGIFNGAELRGKERWVGPGHLPHFTRASFYKLRQYIPKLKAVGS